MSSQRPTCETCRFMHRPDQFSMPECRFGPPIGAEHAAPLMHHGAAIRHRTLWPTVWQDDWCHQHQAAPRG